MISLLDSLGSNEKAVLLEAAALVHKASLMGVILTIERTPLKPLAMGHHEATITVYPARSMDAERRRMWQDELARRSFAEAYAAAAPAMHG